MRSSRRGYLAFLKKKFGLDDGVVEHYMSPRVMSLLGNVYKRF